MTLLEEHELAPVKASVLGLGCAIGLCILVGAWYRNMFVSVPVFLQGLTASKTPRLVDATPYTYLSMVTRWSSGQAHISLARIVTRLLVVPYSLASASVSITVGLPQKDALREAWQERDE